MKSVPPQSIENSNFGFSVGRGAYKWEKAVGNWVAVACRIKLNDVGYANGKNGDGVCLLIVLISFDR